MTTAPVSDAGAPEPAPDLEAELAAARAELDRVRARTELERVLREAGAADVEVALAFCESVQRESGERDARAIVAAARKRKPRLFGGHSAQQTGGAMSATIEPDAPARSEALSDAAGKARTSGDRGALLAFLRLRASRPRR